MRPSSESPWSPPDLPRRYTILRKLGSGSFGAVYLVDDAVRKKQVALKLLRVERLTESAASSLQAEFRAIASIRHPRIAAAHDFGYAEDGGVPFYTREHVPGVPLPPGPPAGGSPARFLEPVLDLLDALAFLHAHGMLHLDIHPGNLILADDPRGGGVLIDLARRPPSTWRRQPGSTRSTPGRGSTSSCPMRGASPLTCWAISERPSRRWTPPCRRAAGPFLALGCASIPEGMLESELFGAVAGAYTGVDEDRPGLLDHARGGTVLLDEVSSLSLEAQAKLLRVLDAGTFRPLGGAEERKADVRFLASTSVSLDEACEAGRFRRDLYYRLRSVEVRLPPLRERKEDILYLARHFLSEHARQLGRPTPELAEDALRLVEEHSWPGNVRELEGVLFRALVSRSGGNRIAAADLEPHLSRRAGSLFDDAVIDRHALKDLKAALERQYLVRLFIRSSGDLDLMTKSLGVKRTRLYIWMRRLGIDVRELRKRLRRGS